MDPCSYFVNLKRSDLLRNCIQRWDICVGWFSRFNWFNWVSKLCTTILRVYFGFQKFWFEIGFSWDISKNASGHLECLEILPSNYLNQNNQPKTRLSKITVRYYCNLVWYKWPVGVKMTCWSFELPVVPEPSVYPWFQGNF